MDRLKFIALDKEDLEVVSAHLQDALFKSAEVLWRPQEHRVVIALDRFDWEAATCASKPEFLRRRAALRFERVRACKCRDVKPGGDAMLSLLAVEFDESDAPSGVVTLTCSGGATFRLDVECLEAELADIGPARPAEACPAHAVDNEKTA